MVRRGKSSLRIYLLTAIAVTVTIPLTVISAQEMGTWKLASSCIGCLTFLPVVLWARVALYISGNRSFICSLATLRVAFA